MRSHWRHRLAGLAATIAVALAAAPAYLTNGPALQPSVTAAAPLDCPAGTHWDNTLHHCV